MLDKMQGRDTALKPQTRSKIADLAKEMTKIVYLPITRENDGLKRKILPRLSFLIP